MNALYEAVMALGRSITHFDKYGWLPGVLGGAGEPACSIGALSLYMGGYEQRRLPRGSYYPLDYAHPMGVPPHSCDFDQYEVLHAYAREVFPVAANALVQALTAPQVAALRSVAPRIKGWVFEGSGSVGELQTLIVDFNDNIPESKAEVRRWFSDALDILAQELPIPAEPLFPQTEPQVVGAI